MINSESLFQMFNPYLGFLQQYPYLYALTIFVGFFIVAKLVVIVFEGILMQMAKKTTSEVDDLILMRTKHPLSFILLIIGARLALIPLELTGKTLLYITLGLSTLVILVGIFITILIFDIVIDNWAKHWASRANRRADKQVIMLFRKISRIVIVILGLMFVLNLWGVNASPLIASLGVAGIAVAFALQSTLGNLFGGISLIIDKSVETGDVIELDNGTVGTVFDVGFRSTKLRTFDNEVVIIPNGKLASSQIKNYAPPDPSARLVLPFNVAYGSNVEKVKKTTLDSIKGIKGISKESKPYVRFIEMGDSGLKFKAYIYVEDYHERFSVKDVANTRIYDALNKAKINIPFPQMDVHLKK